MSQAYLTFGLTVYEILGNAYNPMQAISSFLSIFEQ